MKHILGSGEMIKLDIMEIRHTINSSWKKPDLSLISKTKYLPPILALADVI